MKTIIAMGLAAAFLVAPAFVGTNGGTAEAGVKKDRAYWTRVWYKKQARKNRSTRKASYRKSRKPVRTGRGRIKAVVDKSTDAVAL